MAFIRKCFSALFLLIPAFACSAPAVSVSEQNALDYLRLRAFEMTRLNIVSMAPGADAPASISQISSRIMSRHRISPVLHRPVYLYEYYNPDKLGLIDGCVSPEDFYSLLPGPEDEISENGYDWIDYLLLSMSADAKYSDSSQLDINDGSRILEMLENNDGRGIDGLEEAKKTEELPLEFSYSRKDGSLRRFSYDGEQFAVWREGDDTVLVNYYGGKLTRKYFDALYRLSKTEMLKMASTARKMNIEKSIEYSYSGESTLPVSSVEEMISEKKRVENHYDESGRIISQLESHYEEDSAKISKNEKKGKSTENPGKTLLLNDKSTSKRYDAKGRVIEEETSFWTYRLNSFGKRIVENRTVRNEYDYSDVTEENDGKPNQKFYENGELHLERKYTGPDSYSETLYFEGGFSVKLLYEGGSKKTEIIYMNNVEQRRRNFDY